MTIGCSSKEVIVDTGVLLAIFNKLDQYHEVAIQLLESYGHKKWVTTWFVLDELCYHLRKKRAVISDIFKAQSEDNIFHFFELQQEHVPRLHKLMNKYSDREIDLADASLILLAEQINHGNILSFDSDFDVYRWSGNNTFAKLSS